MQTYGYKEGLYIKDLTTNELVQVSPFLYNEYLLCKQVPKQWVYSNENFDKSSYEYCTLVDKDVKYTILSSSSKGFYCSENVFDRNVQTAWVEDEEDYIANELNKSKYTGKGLGEWIRIYCLTEASLKSDSDQISINYIKPMCLSGVKIINGYAKNENTYFANNRIKKAEVILSDGTSYIFELQDNKLGFQTLDFGKEVITRMQIQKHQILRLPLKKLLKLLMILRLIR